MNDAVIQFDLLIKVQGTTSVFKRTTSENQTVFLKEKFRHFGALISAHLGKITKQFTFLYVRLFTKYVIFPAKTFH